MLVLIVGGGLTGETLAARLSQNGQDVGGASGASAGNRTRTAPSGRRIFLNTPGRKTKGVGGHSTRKTTESTDRSTLKSYPS